MLGNRTHSPCLFRQPKGIASTLLHILVDQGLLDYNDPVSKHWPEFGQKGKKDITVRQLLCHEACLFHIREMIDDAEQMLDWNFMIGAIERARPVHTPGQHNGYHALTYGWLIGELIHRVTNQPFEQVLLEKLSKPLGLDGLFVGMPSEQNKRRAYLINSIGGERTGKQVERILQRNVLKAVTQGLKLVNVDLNQTHLSVNSSRNAVPRSKPRGYRKCLYSRNEWYVHFSLIGKGLRYAR